MMRNPRITNDPKNPTHSLIFKKLGVQLNDAETVSTKSWNADPIQVPIGRVTRARRAKKFHNALNGLIQGIFGLKQVRGGPLMVTSRISSP